LWRGEQAGEGNLPWLGEGGRERRWGSRCLWRGEQGRGLVGEHLWCWRG